MMDLVQETLERVSFAEGSLKIVLWTTHFYDIKNSNDLPASHDDLKKLKLAVLSPLSPPKLHELEMELNWGSLPTHDDLKKFLNDKLGKLRYKWSSIKESSAETILRKNQVVPPSNQILGVSLSEPSKSKIDNSNHKHAQSKRSEKFAFLTHRGNIVGGGTTVVLNALAAYLRYLEGTVRDDWQEVHEKLRNAESREGASFGALFGPALCLGIVSRRRVHYEAIKYEKERNAGFLPLFGYSAATVAAAVDSVCSIEWYWLMASTSQVRDVSTCSIRVWRWNGYMIQYTVSGHEGPATLLVHGFDAFLEHYRDNANGIAEGGNRVWAITLLGFGRSEKPNIVYTELVWAELLRDFIVEVVGEPVHLVGNSLGGLPITIDNCFITLSTITAISSN